MKANEDPSLKDLLATHTMLEHYETLLQLCHSVGLPSFSGQLKTCQYGSTLLHCCFLLALTIQSSSINLNSSKLKIQISEVMVNFLIVTIEIVTGFFFLFKL